MQIANILQSSSIAIGRTANRPACKASPRQSGGQDQVQISSQESQFARVQASYEAGTYNVSPSQIANSILNDTMLR